MEAKNAVCYVVSGNYTKQLSVSLLSLVKSYLSDVTLDVYVFNEQVAAEDLLVLEKLPAMVGKPQIHVKSRSLVELPAELIGKVKEHLNPLYLQRLFLPGVQDQAGLSVDPERCLPHPHQPSLHRQNHQRQAGGHRLSHRPAGRQRREPVDGGGTPRPTNHRP